MALTSEQKKFFEALKRALSGDGPALEALYGGFVPGTISSDNIANDSDTVVGGSVSDALDSNQADIATLVIEVSDNDAEILALEGRVTTNEGNITALDGRVTTNESDIATLQAQVADLIQRVTLLENPPGEYYNPPGPFQTTSGTYADLDVHTISLQTSGLYLVDSAVQYGNDQEKQKLNRWRINLSDGTDTIIGEDFNTYNFEVDDYQVGGFPSYLNIPDMADLTVTLQGTVDSGRLDITDYRIRVIRVGDAVAGGFSLVGAVNLP